MYVFITYPWPILFFVKIPEKYVYEVNSALMNVMNKREYSLCYSSRLQTTLFPLLQSQINKANGKINITHLWTIYFFICILIQFDNEPNLLYLVCIMSNLLKQKLVHNDIHNICCLVNIIFGKFIINRYNIVSTEK